MKRKMIRSWPGIAVLACCLAPPAMAAQGNESQESGAKPSRGYHTRADAEERWKKVDRDNDGRISRAEWQRNEQAFDRMDADRDGFLTKEELRSAAREFREKGRSRFREMDADADGHISRGEWKGKEEMFNRLDANKDGVLSRDELRGARKPRGPGSHRSDQSDNTTL